MFRSADLVLVNKIDLLPHLDFSMSEALADVSRVNPGVTVLAVSARSGEGLEAWFDWILLDNRLPLDHLVGHSSTPVL